MLKHPPSGAVQSAYASTGTSSDCHECRVASTSSIRRVSTDGFSAPAAAHTVESQSESAVYKQVRCISVHVVVEVWPVAAAEYAGKRCTYATKLHLLHGPTAVPRGGPCLFQALSRPRTRPCNANSPTRRASRGPSVSHAAASAPRPAAAAARRCTGHADRSTPPLHLVCSQRPQTPRQPGACANRSAQGKCGGPSCIHI